MVISNFPPISKADKSGLVAIGGDLEIPSLLLAYKSGIFPWPIDEKSPITWFSPPQRAVLFFKNFHISTSLKKLLKRNENTKQYSFKFNQDFRKIITHCADSETRTESGTWITKEMISAYTKLFEAGSALCLGCYESEKLVAGLYGVKIGKMFAGESMFHLQANTSKLCLVNLVQFLSSEGLSWLDCQQMTPLFESFGAELLSRENFLELLRQTLAIE